MTQPVRLQLSRRKGFGLQAWSREVNGLPAVRVSRPGPFGNPFTVSGCRDAGFSGSDAELAARCVGAFRVWLGPHWRENWDGEESERRRAYLLSRLSDLRGHNLACWCALDGGPCHADVLLEIVNPGAEARDA